MDSHGITPMTRPWAEKISTWHYAGAYALYSFDGSAESVEELLEGGYFAWVNGAGEPEGYFCFGTPAQIPTQEPDVYREGYLDIGLGLAPELCGQGLGGGFLAEGLAFAREQFRPKALRLTVASFNKRAIAVYARAGFAPLQEVTHRRSGMAFTVMVREE